MKLKLDTTDLYLFKNFLVSTNKESIRNGFSKTNMNRMPRGQFKQFGDNADLTIHVFEMTLFVYELDGNI